MNEIEGLSVSGSGRLFSSGPVECDDVSLRVSGSGDLNLKKLSADRIACGISGSGNIGISGPGADSGEISVSGSGNFNSVDFKLKDLDVSISGSGGCKVFVTNDLKARVSGSGNVYYDGNPSRVDAKSSGSGKVRKMQ